MWFHAHKFDYNHELTIRTSFLDPENMDKDTNIDFLPRIFRRYGVSRSCSFFAQAAILSFAHKVKLPNGTRVASG